MIEKLKNLFINISSLKFAFIIGLLNLVLFNIPLLKIVIDYQGLCIPRKTLIFSSLLFLIPIANALIVYILSLISRHLAKILWIIFFLINAVVIYFIKTYNIILDEDMIGNVMNTNKSEAISFFSTHRQSAIAARLQPLEDVGLGYIKLGQNSSTLSGGENQRVKLAYFIAQEKAAPTLFIFDEPTTGLHFHDIRRLLEAMSALISRGHSVLVIEHNMDVILSADHVIDLGPDGGDGGGNLIFAGTPEALAACPESITGKYLQSHLIDHESASDNV